MPGQLQIEPSLMGISSMQCSKEHVQFCCSAINKVCVYSTHVDFGNALLGDVYKDF